MAQVTMSNQEYMQLQRKADMFDKLFSQVINNYKVTFDEDTTWHPVRIDNMHNYDAELEKRIVTMVADQLAANEHAMDYLVKEDEYLFDMHKCETASIHWDNRLYIGQYDMRECSEAFEYAWAAAQVRNNPESHEVGEGVEQTEELEVVDAEEEK